MRKIRRVLFAVLLGLFLLEAVLQIGSLIVSFGADGQPGAGSADGAARILCIGDSYTYGLGASDPARNSYPGVLQRLLAGADAPVVVNAGWPGQNSREALLHLPEQLKSNRPQLVCVLIGLNDGWSRPQPVDDGDFAAGSSRGWQLRWRTWRLLQLVFGSSAAAVDPIDPVAPARGPTAPTESTAPTTSTNGTTQKPTAVYVARAVRQIEAGQSAAALQTLQEGVIRDPDNAAEYHQGIIGLKMSLGHRDEADESLAWLRREYQERPTARVAESYCVSLAAVGQRKQGAATARSALQRYPDTSPLWWLSGQAYYDVGDLAAAERDLDRAIATSMGNPQWRAVVSRDCARACCRRDATKAIRLLLDAMRLVDDIAMCRRVVEGARSAFSSERVQLAVRQLEIGGEDLQRLQRLFDPGEADRSGMCRVLGGHLRRIIAHCRQSGAEVLLMTYPLPIADIQAVYGEVAADLNVPLVACGPAFKKELQRRSRDELYVSDGHCNDAGYELMAQLALEPVGRALKR